ncbi:MAG: glycosyltransferase family 2 protein [Candidatus Aenigmarchaeota archaeon]|nr:glycosyltransferase family 2 protein [Candidatus Aenigmarchaeota archaeon]
MPKVIAVIPSCSGERTIGDIVKKSLNYVDEVIVIDDSFNKKISKIAERYGAIIFCNQGNKGVGYSRRRGIKEALKRDADIIVTLDDDLQHRPEDIPRFVKKINQGYGVVIGARDLKKYPFIKKFGNFWLTLLTNFVCGTNIRDTESGYKGFSGKAAKKLDLKADRYEIEAEIVYEIGKNKLKYACIKIDSPIYRKGVTVGKGIKNFIYLLNRKISDLLAS